MRPELTAKTTTPSHAPHACSVDGRLDLHGAKPSRAARHGSGTLALHRFEAAAAGLSRCRLRTASVNGVEWCAPRFGRKYNHAKSASARVLLGRSAGSPRGEARAGRAARVWNAMGTVF